MCRRPGSQGSPPPPFEIIGVQSTDHRLLSKQGGAKKTIVQYFLSITKLSCASKSMLFLSKRTHTSFSISEVQFENIPILMEEWIKTGLLLVLRSKGKPLSLMFSWHYLALLIEKINYG